MNCEDGVRAGRINIQVVVSDSARLLTFKKTVQCLFLISALWHSDTSDGDFTNCILLDTDARSRLFGRGYICQHIKHELIIDFNKGDPNCDLIVETATNFRENLVDSSGDKATVLVVSR
jgi:hypothetical protein